MNGDTYDEDLEKNPFFAALRLKAPSLFRQVLAQKLYILVPKRDSFKGFAKADPLQVFKRHIVRLEERSDGEVGYWNLEGNAIATSDDGQVLTLYNFEDSDNHRKSVSVRLLFEETYFTEDGASCRLICISRPLFYTPGEKSEQNRTNFSLDISSATSGQASPSTVLPFSDASPASTSLSDPFHYYDQVLFHNDYENNLQRQLRKNLSRFAERITNEYKSSWHFEQLKTLVREEFYATLRDILSQKRVSAEKLDSNGISRLQISVEIYFYRCIHTRLLSLLCACVRDEESSLNKLKHAASELAPSDWGIAPELYGDLPTARKQLAKLNEADNPYGKLLCLRKTIALLTSSARTTNGKRVPISTDELIPPLAFLIAKSNIFNWVANILYITQFHFSAFANDELGYCLASFEAAAQFVKDDSMKPVVLVRWRDWALGKALNNSQEKSSIVDVSEKETEDPNVADVDYWECVIAALQSNDEAALRDCMNAGAAGIGSGEGSHIPAAATTTIGADGPSQDVGISIQKCHPLCECLQCLDKRKERRYSINCVTAQGFTVLHFAALFGQTSMLHYLIRSGGKAILENADERGRTPLHWACCVGSQSCTLLLLHHGAMSSPVDHVGNTPLHLATYYGYIDCVKALLYFNHHVRGASARVNLINHAGETALHAAVRCHHVDIISVLLECGANAKLRDKRGKTAFDLCEDFETHRLLTLVSPFAEIPVVDTLSYNQAGTPTFVAVAQDTNPSSDGGLGNWTFSSASALIDLNIEKIDKLLKAVADDDLPLPTFSVKYYLGNLCKEQPSGRCHPLCQCPKCQEFDDEVEDGVNINATGSNGLNALHTAVLFNQSEVLRYLLQCCGADVNWPSAADGRTCLHLAAMLGNLSVIELLVENEADFCTKDSAGDTPLHLLVSTGNVLVLRSLIAKYGTDRLNMVNSSGDTLLHKAVKENQANMVSALLELGANSAAENDDHMTAFECALTDDVRKAFSRKA